MRTDSDIQLARAVADRVSRPRRDPADSFVLHAPLELAARVGLLPLVRPHDRDRARARIAEVGTLFDAAGPEAPEPRLAPVASTADAASRLAAAIEAGDLDDTDAYAAALAGRAAAHELPGLLADDVLPRLAAAGHAPIFLHLLPRVAPRGELPVGLLRPLARELARSPESRLTWFDTVDGDVAGDTAAGEGPAELADAIASVPHLDPVDGTFILPTMSLVERAGVPSSFLAQAVAKTPPADAATTLLRLAVHSMLIEPADHAPYGWSHALTMTQAAVAMAPHTADPRTAVAVAATYLAGFRSTLGVVDLATPYAPPPPPGDLTWALREDPSAAAAAVWHAEPFDVVAVASEVASAASRRHDAHLVKYTLACIDAAAADPAEARRSLAAAARLLGHWIEHPDPQD